MYGFGIKIVNAVSAEIQGNELMCERYEYILYHIYI